jgi:hypothetical protein
MMKVNGVTRHGLALLVSVCLTMTAAHGVERTDWLNSNETLQIYETMDANNMMPTSIEGQSENGKYMYRLKFAPKPGSVTQQYAAWGNTPDWYDERHAALIKAGFEQTYHSTFKMPWGAIRHQAVWRTTLTDAEREKLVGLSVEQRCGLLMLSESMPREHPYCLYRTGYDHYDRGRNTASYQSFQELAELPSIPARYTFMLPEAYNMLGYFTWYGKGTLASPGRAVYFWERGITLGGLADVSYRLCYVYGDPYGAFYSPEEALKHCDIAENFYSKRNNSSEIQYKLDYISRYRKLMEEAR